MFDNFMNQIETQMDALLTYSPADAPDKELLKRELLKGRINLLKRLDKMVYEDPYAPDEEF